MIKIFFVLLYFALLAVTAVAQQKPVIEYGTPDELKGITKIYIDTGTDMEVRSNIIKEINKSQKKLSQLTVVNSPEEAEVFLVFSADSSTYVSNVVTTTPSTSGSVATSTPYYSSVITGGGSVIKPLGENRIRLLMDFKDTRSSKFERRPSTNFARAFVKAYLKVNSEVEKK